MFNNRGKRPYWAPKNFSNDSHQSERPYKKFQHNRGRGRQNEHWTNRQPRTDNFTEATGSPVSNQRNPEVYTDECESYFKKSLETLKSGIEEDQKEIFVHNVLEQTEGQELHVSRHSINSYCVQILLRESNNRSTIVRFLKAFATNKEDAFGNKFVRHVTEDLFYLSLCQLQNWFTDIEVNEDEEDTEAITKANELREIMILIQEFGEFCSEHLETCLEDEYGCKVLGTLIQVLGGCYIKSPNNNKKVIGPKRIFNENYSGSGFNFKEKESITLNEVPKLFVDVLKKLAKAFLELNSLKTHTTEVNASHVLQSILFVFKRRLPKRFQNIVKALIQVLFEEKNSNNISTCLVHKSSSYIVEKLFELVSNDQQLELWNNYFNEHLELIVVNPIGNYVIQRLFDVVEDKAVFEVMCTAIFDFFTTIFRARHFGVLVSVASACKKLECQQAQFMKAIMTCLHCLEPVERQIHLIPLLLGLQTFEDYMRKSDEDESVIVLQGSLLAEAILRFLKPIKAVNSILNLKSENIQELARHAQGCHVLTNFLDSPNVGEKNKDKFLEVFKPAIKLLAMDRNGGLTISRMWVLLTIKQRAVIAQEMVNNEKEIGETHNGSIILKKCRIFQFKKKYHEWKEFQETLVKKDKSKSCK